MDFKLQEISDSIENLDISFITFGAQTLRLSLRVKYTKTLLNFCRSQHTNPLSTQVLPYFREEEAAKVKKLTSQASLLSAQIQAAERGLQLSLQKFKKGKPFRLNAYAKLINHFLRVD